MFGVAIRSRRQERSRWRVAPCPGQLYPSDMVGLCSVAGRDRVVLDCGQTLPVYLRNRIWTVVRSSGGYVQGV